MNHTCTESTESMNVPEGDGRPFNHVTQGGQWRSRFGLVR